MFRPTILSRVGRLSLKPIQQTASYIIPPTKHKNIPVYPPLPKKTTRPVLDVYQEQCYEKLDPTGWRRNLLKYRSETQIRTGDVIRIVYNTRAIPPFMGQIIDITRGGVEASVVLRNNITKLGVEMRVKLFSPLIARIDMIKKPTKRRGGNKHYYIRGTKYDVKDLEAELKKTRRKNSHF